MGRLAGKVAVVTGAASQAEGVGNGAAVAMLFAKEGAKVVLVNRSLERARALGDALFVALNGDASVRALKGPGRPVQGERERAYALGALAAVDAVVIFNTPRLTAEIAALRPDVYCKGGDYTPAKLDPGERAELEAVRARLEFVPFLPGFSTTSLIAKIAAAAGI